MTFKIFKKIFQQNRLGIYNSILLFAKKNDYIITSLNDWYNNYLNSNKKVLILRHDVDYDSKGAFEMYKIEKELGIKSTFYFRWSTMNSPIMKEMKKNGFEVSLHYESLASYAKKNNITNEEQVSSEIIRQSFENLVLEIKEFESKYWKLHTICSHGDKVNRQLKVSNHKIIRYEKLKELDILFNVYNPDIIKKFEAYISDSSIYSNFEWNHFGSPKTAIENGYKSICLLTHPVHWNQSFFKNFVMLYRVYKDNS